MDLGAVSHGVQPLLVVLQGRRHHILRHPGLRGGLRCLVEAPIHRSTPFHALCNALLLPLHPLLRWHLVGLLTKTVRLQQDLVGDLIQGLGHRLLGSDGNPRARAPLGGKWAARAVMIRRYHSVRVHFIAAFALKCDFLGIPLRTQGCVFRHWGRRARALALRPCLLLLLPRRPGAEQQHVPVLASFVMKMTPPRVLRPLRVDLHAQHAADVVA
mmetsp:Transcript_53751/g.142965  ORF Transcript_53751/g.142965 Transcript_53751/m.142965 type:complete len:214 (-) Transcript_53751:2438-3079(-)